MERTVAKLKKTQKKLDNRLRALANQVEKGDAYKWRREGLRIQQELGLKVLTKCRAAETAQENHHQENLVKEYIKHAIGMLVCKNKELRIADESGGGWEKVNAYPSHPVADNHADDKVIRRAEKMGKERLAAKQRKNKSMLLTNICLPASRYASTAACRDTGSIIARPNIKRKIK